MKFSSLFYLLVTLCTVCHAGEILAKVLSNDTFDKLSIRQAGVTARKMATNDFQAGRFALLYISKDPWNDAANAYLKSNYGVDRYFNPIRQTDPMLNAIEVYNETMQDLLKKKFGKDVIKEALEKAAR